MALWKVIIIAICVSVHVHSREVDLPEAVKTCKKDSDDYASCLRLAIQESWPIFVNGIPELNVPQLDPFVVDVSNNNFAVGEVTGRISVRNSKSYGLAKARFLSLRPYHEDDHFRLDIDYEIPKVLIEGDYKAEGTIGAFRIGGKGQFNISMTDVRCMLVLEGPVISDRWVVERLSLTPEVGDMKIWASDLFNGNQQLTRSALSFANEYWEILYRGMLPFAAKTWNASLKDLVNGIFANLAFSKTFP